MLESFYFCFITFSTIGFGDFVAFDEKEANTFADYLVVFLGVVLGFAVTSTVLFSFSSVMEDNSQETKVLAKFREFKKRLKKQRRNAAVQAIINQENENLKTLKEKIEVKELK